MIYSYSQKIYSSRMIAKALRENVNFMWIAGGNQPDFRTINRFRLQMKDIIEDVFFEVVKLLIEKKYIKLQNYFLDGTKIEANANKYSFVWNKSVRNYDRKLDEKIKKHLREIDRIVAEENRIYLEEDLEEKGEHTRITAEQVAAVVKSIDKKLEQEPKNKQLKKKAREFKKDILPRKQKYDKSLETFKGRNSYSKTDQDATFMRMKEDAMLNGQLKPGYNVNVATASEYIIGNYISADRTDTKTFIPFLKKLCKKHPVKRVTVDSGYESEENYRYVDGSEQLSLFVKPSNHEQKKKKKYKNDIGRRENMPYNAEKDEYTCANGKQLKATGVKKRKSDNGYVQEVTVYECTDCKGCPLKEKCIRQKKSDKTPLEERAKRLEVSKYFIAQREAMEQKISTEEGILLRLNRSIQAEGVFAMIKQDMNFRRFMTRGKNTVSTEWFLLSMAYNILKLHHKIQTGRLGTHLVVPKAA